MLSILVSRSALRTAGAALARPSTFSGLSRATTLSFRTFLTSAPAQLAAKAATTKATTKTKSKEGTKAKPKPKPKASRATKKPVAKAKKPAAAKKPVKPKFDPKLLSPPKRRANTSYAAFLSTTWNKIEGTTFGDKIKAATQAWHKLSEAERQPYTDLAKNNSETYEKEYTEWFVSLPKGYFHEANVRRKSMKKTLLRKPKSLRIPPCNGYMLFHTENVKTHPELVAPQAGKLSGERWRAMSQEEKDLYHQRARQFRSDFLQAHPEAAQSLEFNRVSRASVARN